MYSLRLNSKRKAGTILTYASTIEIQKYSSQIENIVKSLLFICHVNSKSNWFSDKLQQLGIIYLSQLEILDTATYF